LICADASAGRSILVFKQDVDKIMVLDSHKLLSGSGTPADCANFNEFIQKNLKLYELNNDVKLNTSAAANFLRGELATALRRGPYQTNVLLAGYDEIGGPSLYYVDYLASLTKVGFGAHGYASNFILSTFDRDFKKGMPLEQGLEVIRKCINELHTRFLISQPNFVVKVVDKDGCREVKI
jgi:20S proteasome alpha/beta subunit